MYQSLLRIRRYFYNSNFLYCIRIFIALSGVTLGPWLLGNVKLTIPLTLGVVAAALTDLDDRLTGRLRNLTLTLFCFLLATVSIQLLIPYPGLFALGLLVSTFGFILLGTLGQRYATIAFGALLIAIYTMLGSDMYDVWFIQPVLLLSGAIWYNLLTLFGHLILPIRPVQDNVARCFEQLAHYLDTKAMLFDPDEENGFQRQLFDLSMANSALVNILNQTKISLLTRLKNDRGQRGTRRLLHYYFVAQDIHERTSSVHVKYQALSETLRYSDVLFRFQRLLSLQAQACRKITLSIMNRTPYSHDSYFERSFSYLNNTLTRLANNTDISPHQLEPLRYLLRNLREIDAQLANIESEQTLSIESMQDNHLSDDRPEGLHDIWQRITRQLTPKSALFRHAVRMSIVLVTGYAIIQATSLYEGHYHGYWIMLTSLFVCQPNYNATRHRLLLRVIGTVSGILIGLPILYFIPSIEGQLILIVISGLLFFAFRNVQYAHATMFITLLVLLCFNLIGEGFEIALPRIIDTLVGCAIAWIAVSYIWPDWRFRQLPTVIEHTINASCRYLDAILVQYHQGKSNSLEYRIARRDAYSSDAELATVISGLSVEPKKDNSLMELGFRLLCLNHTLLGYISALGAHREQLTNPNTLHILDDTVCYISDVLQSDPSTEERTKKTQIMIEEHIEQLHVEMESKDQLVIQQIALIFSVLPEFLQLVNQIKLQSDNTASQTNRHQPE